MPHDIVDRPGQTRLIEQIPRAPVPGPHPLPILGETGFPQGSRRPRLEAGHHPFGLRVRRDDDMDMVRPDIDRVQKPTPVFTHGNDRVVNARSCFMRKQKRFIFQQARIARRKPAVRGCVCPAPSVFIDDTASAVPPEPGAVGGPRQEIGERGHRGRVHGCPRRVRPLADARGSFPREGGKKRPKRQRGAVAAQRDTSVSAGPVGCAVGLRRNRNKTGYHAGYRPAEHLRISASARTKAHPASSQ